MFTNSEVQPKNWRVINFGGRGKKQHKVNEKVYKINTYGSHEIQVFSLE